MRAERRIITLLAADIAQSTQHIAGADPEDAQLFFDRWFEHLRQTVETYDGKLVSYEGDGGIVAFGWPIAREDHADQACAAAWALSQLPPQAGPDGRPARVRIGVHAGLAAVRSLDRDGRSHLNVIGAPVHVAAKLQQAAPLARALISEDALGLCRRRPITVDRPSQEPTLPVSASLLGAPAPAPCGGEVLHRYRHAILGRDLELAQILEGLTNPQGAGRAIIVLGEAGVGKSRLAAAVAEAIVAQGAEILAFFGDAQRRTTPFAVALGLISERVGARGQALLDELAGRVASGCLERDDVDALRHLLASESKTAAARMNRTQLSRALTRILRGLCAEQSILVLVEDLHLIDPESLEFLIDLAKQDTLALLVTARPERREDVAALGGRRVDLAPLPRAVMADLGRQLAQSPLNPTWLERVLDRADGVPLVLEELVRGLDSSKPPQAVPAGIASIVHARLQHLSTGARALAEALSLLGQDTDLDLLGRVLGSQADALTQDLCELEQFAFVHPLDGVSPCLRHQIIAEACAETIPRERRRLLHRTVFDVLLGRHGGAEDRYEQLAFHAEAAGELFVALDMLVAAALAARRKAAAGSLNLIFDRALALIGRIGEAAEARYQDLVLMAAASLVQLGEVDKIQAHLARAMPLARRGGRADRIASALSQQAMIHWYQGHYAEGQAAAREGLTLASELDSPALIFSLQVMLANHLQSQGQLDQALGSLRALDLILTGELANARLGATGLPRVVTLSFLSWFCVDADRLEEGLKAAEDALAEALAQADDYSEVLARTALGRCLLAMGKISPADQALERAWNLAEQIGYDTIKPNLAGWRAMTSRRLGQPIKGLGLIEVCLARGLDRRTGQLEIYCLRAGQAEAMAGLARWREALSAADAAVDLARRVSNPWLLADGLARRGWIRWKGGQGWNDDLVERQHIRERLGLCPEDPFKVFASFDAAPSAQYA